MAHTPKIPLYVIERRLRNNSKDTKRVVGLPSDVEALLGIFDQPVFVTSSRQLADKYQREMLSLWGKTCDYVVITKQVRV
jgi:hypothetical protein